MIIKPSVKANHPSVNIRTFIRIRITPIAAMAHVQGVYKGFTLLGLHSPSTKATHTAILRWSVRWSVESFSSFRQSVCGQGLAPMGLETTFKLKVIQLRRSSTSISKISVVC